MKIKHGHTGKFKKPTPTYRSWASMKKRCRCKSVRGYHNYGGRGIKVCDRWLQSFENFLADMGERPPGTSLNRIDSNGHYEPVNCEWATTIQQGRNRRTCVMLEFRGKRQCINAWSEETGIGSVTLQHRVRSGWPIERALTEPATLKKPRKRYNGTDWIGGHKAIYTRRQKV